MTNPFHPEIELNIEITVIRAQRRKLKATWTMDKATWTMDVEIVRPDPATIEALTRIVLEEWNATVENMTQNMVTQLYLTKSASMNGSRRDFAVLQQPVDPPQPNLNNDIFLVRANDFIDAGYIFTPYVPLMSTPPILDPDYMSRRVERVEVEKAEDVNWVKEGF